MVATICQVYDIQSVTTTSRGDGGVRLAFQNGLAATLPTAHPDYDLLLDNAEQSRQHQQPVGVLVDEHGRIVDLNYTYQVSVSLVRDDDEDPNRLLAAFWGFSAICYLTRDHPEIERIRTTLTEALASGKPVVFANHLWPVEGETEVWNKLLDVRPVRRPGA